MNFPSLLSIILTLFLLLACGYFCRRKEIIDTLASKRLSKLILSIGQPMLIIASLNKAEYSKANLSVAWQVTLLGFALHTLIAILAYLLKPVFTLPNFAGQFLTILAVCAPPSRC